MATPTSADGKRQAPSRDLRDSVWFRLAALLVVLLLAFLATRSCADRGESVDQNEAIEIARGTVSFTPDNVQVRYVQRGIPPQGFWAVSLYTLDANGQPQRVRVVLVNAKSGEVGATSAPAAGASHM